MIRLKYEELFEFMFKINYLKEENKKANSGIARSIDESKVDEFISHLPYELTKDQITVVNTIIKDLESPNRMNRLLQGDVGSVRLLFLL